MRSRNLKDIKKQIAEENARKNAEFQFEIYNACIDDVFKRNQRLIVGKGNAKIARNGTYTPSQFVRGNVCPANRIRTAHRNHIVLTEGTRKAAPVRSDGKNGAARIESAQRLLYKYKE